MPKLKERRRQAQLQKLRDRFYHDVRAYPVCSCGRQAVGLTGKPSDYLPPYSSLLVCDFHDQGVSKKKYWLPPWPEFNPEKPVFNGDEWLSQVPYYTFEKNL